MLESACVLNVADLSPNELFLLHLGEAIQQELAQALLGFSLTSGVNPSDNVFIISVQPSAAFLRGKKRSVGGGVDLLIAVYDPRERRFIESNHLVQRIHGLQGNLSRAIGHQIHAYNSLCAQKVGSLGLHSIHSNLLIQSLHCWFAFNNLYAIINFQYAKQ